MAFGSTKPEYLHRYRQSGLTSKFPAFYPSRSPLTTNRHQLHRMHPKKKKHNAICNKTKEDDNSMHLEIYRTCSNPAKGGEVLHDTPKEDFEVQAAKTYLSIVSHKLNTMARVHGGGTEPALFQPHCVSTSIRNINF